MDTAQLFIKSLSSAMVRYFLGVDWLKYACFVYSIEMARLELASLPRWLSDCRSRPRIEKKKLP